MPPQWRKRGEKIPEPEKKTDPIKIQFPVDDLEPRNRKKSFKEKIADIVQEGAKILTITTQKFKKNKEEEEKLRKLKSKVERDLSLHKAVALQIAVQVDHLQIIDNKERKNPIRKGKNDLMFLNNYLSQINDLLTFE